MRIAVGGLHIECSTYNPVLTVEQDFLVLRGADLLEHSYFSFLGDYQAQFLPLLHARAIAGGPIARETYEDFKTELLQRLTETLPLDGVYLAMHGAMFVHGLEDAEGDLIAAVRALAGEACLISASYDLHGNISQAIIDALDMFSTYRTAPHIDVENTMRRAVAMLVRALETGEKPGLVWAPIPVLMPGEKSSTVDEPARQLYAVLPALEGRDGMWDASLQVGYVWADEPRATAAAVMTGTNRVALAEAARKVAEAYWSKRHAFAFGVATGSIAACVARASAIETKPVILAESGDNPTGGGVGDRAELLAALLEVSGKCIIFAGIADAPAAAMAFAAGVGAEISCSIGATLDASSTPAKVTAQVAFLSPGGNASEREAVLQVGQMQLVISAKRRPYHYLADFARLGLDVKTADIVVVKSGYLSPELAPLARPALMALSPGVVDQDIERLPRLRKMVPMFPFDKDFEFVPRVFASARFGGAR